MRFGYMQMRMVQSYGLLCGCAPTQTYILWSYWRKRQLTTTYSTRVLLVFGIWALHLSNQLMRKSALWSGICLWICPPYLRRRSQHLVKRYTFGFTFMLCLTRIAVSIAWPVTVFWIYCGDGWDETIFSGGRRIPALWSMMDVMKGKIVDMPMYPHCGTRDAANPSSVSLCLVPE